jgi:hypothetical protein
LNDSSEIQRKSLNKSEKCCWLNASKYYLFKINIYIVN